MRRPGWPASGSFCLGTRTPAAADLPLSERGSALGRSSIGGRSGCGGIRTEREGILVGRFLKPLLERGDTAVREDRIMSDEVCEQVVEVPERVVHRRGGEEDDLPRRVAAEKLPECARAFRVRVPESVRLVDHDEGVVVDVGPQCAPLSFAELLVIRELLE